MLDRQLFVFNQILVSGEWAIGRGVVGVVF